MDPICNIVSELAEGPMWHPKELCLYWVDILGKKLHRFDPVSKESETFSFDHMPGAVVPLASNDTLLLSFENGIATFNTKQKTLDYLLYFHENKPNLRANDGKCDPFGNFWVGTMDKACEPNAGSLYIFDSQKILTEKVKDVTISNGLVWSNNKNHMYYIDTTTDTVVRYDCDSLGNISNKKVVIRGDFEKLGYLDGMTIDSEGMLWIAHCNGHCIRRWNPANGEILETFELPVPKVTSLTFGGQNLDTLYITTAREHMKTHEIAQYPLSGYVFSLKTNTNGLRTNSYKNQP
jgi:sugar lactone lactonase YvrE